MSNLDRLPLEILSLILYHVSDRNHCALVNKQFYSVVNPLLWRFPLIWNVTLDEFLNMLATTPHALDQHIHQLPRNLRWTDTRLLSLMKYIKNVESLNNDCGSNITDEIPTTSTLSQSQSLHVTSVCITHRSMIALGQHCHQLNRLILSNCISLSANTFSAL